MSDIYRALNALAYSELDELGIPRDTLKGIYVLSIRILMLVCSSFIV